MRIAHILRKYNPEEWGGTETALERLFSEFRRQDVASLVFCPQLEDQFVIRNDREIGVAIRRDPFTEAGCTVKRFKACVPIWGISSHQRRQYIAVGGNLMSFDLIADLWREAPVSLIHSHTLGRLGGIASRVARYRKLPFVITVHGGLLDLPEELKASFYRRLPGLEWGKLFGALLRSRQLLNYADVIITCNPREATLLQEKFPSKQILTQPHGVDSADYRVDHRLHAESAFPQIRNKKLLLTIGRIDPVKNQEWLIQNIIPVFQKYSDTYLMLVGACTAETYGRKLKQRIDQLGLNSRVLIAGGIPPRDPRLIGLFQSAQAVIIPSISETFGLVILESWASGTLPIASCTSGAKALVKNGENGWLFELSNVGGFFQTVDSTLSHAESRTKMITEGRRLIAERYDTGVLVGRLKRIYEQLIERNNHALCNH